MGAKNQALKNAARRRAEETGQAYEAALQDVRREYEAGEIQDDTDQGQDGTERMGFAEPPQADEYRPRLTGYFFAWGAVELAGVEQLRTFVDYAEGETITCFLCGKTIEVVQEREVHVGLVLREVRPPGEDRVTEAQMPVWTHEGCGHARVWSWSQITLERRRRGLPIDEADLPPKQRHRGRPATAEEDFYVFTTPADSPPVLYLQPGAADRHGPLGFRASRLSDGLPALDLTREKIRTLPEWSIVADRNGLSHIERQGTGRWYQPSRPWSPPPSWLAAAHYHGTAILLTAPAGSIPAHQLTSGSGDLTALAAVGRGDMLFGATMNVTGLV